MMTAEEKRERLLKRVLPGMAITIVYFVFITGIFSEKMDKAETNYTRMLGKGISPSAIPGFKAQQKQSQKQISTLQAKQRDLKQKLNNLAGFLSNATPSNEASTKLSSILAKNNIRVKNEQRESFSEADLSPALQEVWQWLKPADEKPKKGRTKKKLSKKELLAKETVFIQHLSVSGSYQNMYLAMDSIAKGELKAVPVFLNMKTPVNDQDNADTLDWELMLWM